MFNKKKTNENDTNTKENKKYAQAEQQAAARVEVYQQQYAQQQALDQLAMEERIFFEELMTGDNDSENQQANILWKIFYSLSIGISLIAPIILVITALFTHGEILLQSYWIPYLISIGVSTIICLIGYVIEKTRQDNTVFRRAAIILIVLSIAFLIATLLMGGCFDLVTHIKDALPK